MSTNSFGSRASLRVGDRQYEIYRLDALDKKKLSISHLPYSLRILLENLLRTEDGRSVKADDIAKVAELGPLASPHPGDRFQPRPSVAAGLYRAFPR